MIVTKTKIEGLLIIEPKIFKDVRGYFIESFQETAFKQNVSNTTFIQDNESKSVKGVLRGLHFQLPPFDQAKLVRVITGEVLDIAVDLRKNSPTYGMHQSIVLSEDNKKQFFIPKGFAHGFIVLSETAIFSYKVDNLYSADHDSGILWNDPLLGIDWYLNETSILLSEKDNNLQLFNEFISPF